MRTLTALVLAAACAALAFPAAAPALTSTAPPGNSGIDQYVETVPSAGGNRAVRGTKPGRSRAPVSSRTRRELTALGRDGRAALQLADATAPALASPPATKAPAARPPARTRKPGRKTAPDAAPAAAPRGGAPVTIPAGRSPVASVLASFGGGSDGMGAALPILLLVSLAGAAGYALARLRHRDR